MVSTDRRVRVQAGGGDIPPFPRFGERRWREPAQQATRGQENLMYIGLGTLILIIILILLLT
jgi:hypothetical protein